MPRPRKHPVGTTASERSRASIDALRKTGGNVICVRLSANALKALRDLRKRGYAHSNSAVVAHALSEVLTRFRNHHK